jgi:hypothetical protein
MNTAPSVTFGVTVTPCFFVADSAMAAEIEQLPDLTGVLKIASRPQWRRVHLLLLDARQ